MSGPRTRLVALLSLISGIVLTGPVAAAPKQVIEPGTEDQGFPSFIQDQGQELMRIAQPDREQPGPAGSGIDECVAHCSNGVGW
jgi:hypothetical protein